MTSARILLVHPDPSILALMTSMLHSSGHQIDEVTNDPAAVRRLERGGVDLVLAGANPSDPDSLELLAFTRRKYPKLPFLLLFPGLFPDRAREALRMGALSVLKFPISANELRAAVLQACEKSPGLAEVASAPLNGSASRLNAESRNGVESRSRIALAVPPITASAPAAAPARPAAERTPAADASTSMFAPRLIGDDPAFRRSTELAERIAPTPASVVITGEQGTGKTLLAQAIHQRSGRSTQPLHEVTCAGVDEFLLERDLFGQKFEGGEVSDRPGYLERANRGTLLIEEVSALSPALQDRLLAVMQDGVFTPMGSTKPVSVDIRYLFTSRENLPALVEQGKFRRELHDRINEVSLKLPPLRQRTRDLTTLADRFRELFNREYGKNVAEIAPDARDLLARHDWPGNVRELETVIQRGVAMSQGTRITAASLSLGSLPHRTARPNGYPARHSYHASLNLRPLKQALEEPEKQIIIQTLRALNWNRQETARVLDINRTTLYKKMKKYGLLMEEPALLN